jgi:hypothetical protein
MGNCANKNPMRYSNVVRRNVTKNLLNIVSTVELNIRLNAFEDILNLKRKFLNNSIELRTSKFERNLIVTGMSFSS